MARITAEKKEQTRQRILESARRLFQNRGFDEATTREIAAAAGIAAGTLFNYYPSKEALALAVLDESLAEAQVAFDGRGRHGSETLAEDLFGHVAIELRHLDPHRVFIRQVLDTTLSLFSRPGQIDLADEIRVRHLQAVRDAVATHSCAGAGAGSDALSSFDLHLYWTLYLGVLAFWSADETPNQEATLAMLDQTMRLFVSSLGGP